MIIYLCYQVICYYYDKSKPSGISQVNLQAQATIVELIGLKELTEYNCTVSRMVSSMSFDLLQQFCSILLCFFLCDVIKSQILNSNSKKAAFLNSKPERARASWQIRKCRMFCLSVEISVISSIWQEHCSADHEKCKNAVCLFL